MKYYAGIGSRLTPPEVLTKIEKLAERLSQIGFVLRSGGAVGADQAFERGAKEKEIFRAKDSTAEAEKIAEEVHPAWFFCSPYVRRLHGRNCMIVLGQDLKTPVDFLVCWTNSPDKGGTSLGMKLAKRCKIPVFNLQDPRDQAALDDFLKERENGPSHC